MKTQLLILMGSLVYSFQCDVPNCKECKDTIYCASCDGGFYLKETSIECSSVSYKCLAFLDTACTDCVQHYQLYTDPNGVQYCKEEETIKFIYFIPFLGLAIFVFLCIAGCYLLQEKHLEVVFGKTANDDKSTIKKQDEQMPIIRISKCLFNSSR